MTRLIQIRNVPEALHATLKARAALMGRSLSDYLLDELMRVAERPTRTELLERLALRTPVRPRVAPARAIRAERERR
jgi:plasmid stability protein